MGDVQRAGQYCDSIVQTVAVIGEDSFAPLFVEHLRDLWSQVYGECDLVENALGEATKRQAEAAQLAYQQQQQAQYAYEQALAEQARQAQVQGQGHTQMQPDGQGGYFVPQQPQQGQVQMQRAAMASPTVSQGSDGSQPPPQSPQDGSGNVPAGAANGSNANARGSEGGGAQQATPSKSILGGLGNILSQTISSVTSRCVPRVLYRATDLSSSVWSLEYAHLTVILTLCVRICASVCICLRGVDSGKGINADDMTMYYDEKLKRWVDPAAPESSEAAVTGPPPTVAQSPAPAPAPSGSDEADRSEPGSASGTDDLMAPPPSFRKKKRGARGVPARTSTSGLPGATQLITPGVPSIASDGEPKSFSANETGEGAVLNAAGTGAAAESGVGAGGEEGVAGDEGEGQVVAPDPLSGLGFAVFTPPVSAPTEDGGAADADGTSAGGVDDWLEFKPPEPVSDSDNEGSDDNGLGNVVSGAGSDGVGVGPGMGALSGPLPGMSSPTDGTAAASWMDGGEDIAGLSGGGDEWSGAGSGDGAAGVDDFTAGMAFSAPPGMNLGFLPDTDDGQESTGHSSSEQEELAPTAYWGGGSGSLGTAEPAPEPEHGPEFDTVSESAGKGESTAAADSDEEDTDDDSALAAARSAQTARLAAQIARLKRAGGSADGDVVSATSTSARDRIAEQPPAIDQNADDDDEESEFDPCVKRRSTSPCSLTVAICGAQARTQFALIPRV